MRPEGVLYAFRGVRSLDNTGSKTSDSGQRINITFGESFQIIITAMIDSVCAIFQPTEEQLALFIEMFVGKLPDYIRNSLTKVALAA